MLEMAGSRWMLEAERLTRLYHKQLRTDSCEVRTETINIILIKNFWSYAVKTILNFFFYS
jgi:hypothetical protein